MIPDLIGDWHVTRRIIDLRAGSLAEFRGTARIGHDLFEETGTVRLGGHSSPARRVYMLERLVDAVVLRRSDGSPFVTLTRSPSRQRLVHHCGNDLYRGCLQWAGPDLWAEAWIVRGPAKAYRSYGRFRRS